MESPDWRYEYVLLIEADSLREAKLIYADRLGYTKTKEWNPENQTIWGWSIVEVGESNENEINALKAIVHECSYIGFQGGGISNDDDLPPAYRSLIYRVNKIASDALVRSGCVIEDRLKEKLFRYQ